MFCCVPKKNKSKPCSKKIPIEQLLLYVCENTMPMVNAGVLCFGTSLIEYGGRKCKYSTHLEGNNTTLTIFVMDEIETLLYTGEEKNECVVCTNDTDQLITCCRQSICLKCLKEIKKRSCNDDDAAIQFNCPVCRKDLNNSVSTYNFDKYFLNKLSEVNENEKINFIKQATQ